MNQAHIHPLQNLLKQKQQLSLAVDNTAKIAAKQEQLRAANKAAATKILLEIQASLQSRDSVSRVTTSTYLKNSK